MEGGLTPLLAKEPNGAYRHYPRTVSLLLVNSYQSRGTQGDFSPQVAFQRLFRAEPDAMGGFPGIGRTFLPIWHEGQKEPGVVSLKPQLWGDPVGPWCEP